MKIYLARTKTLLFLILLLLAFPLHLFFSCYSYFPLVRSLLTAMTLDFEDAMGVMQKNENTWVGLQTLNLPVPGARGVYGGHMVAQALLVAIELAPAYVPHSFHSHFIRAGLLKIPVTYQVTRLGDSGELVQRQVLAVQNGRIVYSAMCSLRRKRNSQRLDSAMRADTDKAEKTKSSKIDFLPPVPILAKKYPDPNVLHNVVHTDFVHSAYLDEFVNYELCPEEAEVGPSERWITLWTRLGQEKPLSHPKYNFVGLADISDSSVLTTLVRALHLHWNPTQDNPFQTFDELRDVRNVLEVSLNMMHIYHYNAMSMDHSLYFHVDDFCELDVLGWLTLSHLFKISKNNRTLVRGHFFDSRGKCVASFVQEGLTYMHRGVTHAKF